MSAVRADDDAVAAPAAAPRPLRILLITSDKYPPFRPAARVLFAEELGRRGHSVDWLIQAERESDHHGDTNFGSGRAWVARTDDGASRLRRLHKYWLDLRNDLRMFRLLRTGRYDIVQVKDKYLAALLAIIAARRAGARLCYWLAYPHAEASLFEASEGIARYPALYRMRGLFFGFALYRVILRCVDHAFVQSEQMRRDIAAHGIDAALMTPVPGSLALAEIPYQAAADAAVTREDAVGHAADEPAAAPRRIVYLGTLIRTRRLDFLVRVHARVLRRHPAARLVFIGRGEMPEDMALLLEEARRCGIEHALEFTGQLPMSQAWEHVRRAEIGVSPYFPTPILNSTSPTKLIEYMAMAKPVVGNDHPEQSLVIEQAGAGYCTPWDEDAFAAAICRLLDDPAAAAAMGRRGRAWVAQHRTNSVMATLIEQRYCALPARPQPAGATR